MDEAYLRQLIEALGGPEALRKGAKEFRHCSGETSSTTGTSSMIRRTVYSNAWSATPTTAWKFPDPVQSDAHTHLLSDPANSPSFTHSIDASPLAAKAPARHPSVSTPGTGDSPWLMPPPPMRTLRGATSLYACPAGSSFGRRCGWWCSRSASSL